MTIECGLCGRTGQEKYGGAMISTGCTHDFHLNCIYDHAWTIRSVPVAIPGFVLRVWRGSNGRTLWEIRTRRYATWSWNCANRRRILGESNEKVLTCAGIEFPLITDHWNSNWPLPMLECVNWSPLHRQMRLGVKWQWRYVLWLIGWWGWVQCNLQGNYILSSINERHFDYDKIFFLINHSTLFDCIDNYAKNYL